MPGLERQLEAEFAITLPIQQWLDDDDKLHEEAIRDRVVAEIQQAYDAKGDSVGPDMRRIEKQIMLQVLDTLWKEHLATMDHLRQGIHLRAYAQKNPKQEYKRESFELFQELLGSLKYEVVKFLSHVEIKKKNEAELIEQQRRHDAEQAQLAFQHAQASGMAPDPAESEAPEQAEAAQPITRSTPKVGRNDPCPCGSGKKYKQCHGAL
ncbi:SEC-C metal-binding domain-containing protein [Congregibacter sp.]|nr:SEC-C metal-binding domain-containing protein [Congregibacter sp.]